MAACPVCGRTLPDRTGMRGRPSVYCPPRPGEDVSQCARLEKRMQEVRVLTQRLLDDLGDAETETTRRHYMELRSYLWREINTATNRKRLVSTGRAAYTKKRSGWRRNADAGVTLEQARDVKRAVLDVVLTQPAQRDILPPHRSFRMLASFSVKGAKDPRAAYVFLLDNGLMGATARSNGGALVVEGMVTDSDQAEKLAQGVRALGCQVAVVCSEPVKAPEALVVEAEVVDSAPVEDGTGADVEAADVVEVVDVSATEPVAYPFAFRVKLLGLQPRELVEAGQALCAALVGHVHFAKPSTGWDDGAWCIFGTTDIEALALRALAKPHAPKVSVSHKAVE